MRNETVHLVKLRTLPQNWECKKQKLRKPYMKPVLPILIYKTLGIYVSSARRLAGPKSCTYMCARRHQPANAKDTARWQETMQRSQLVSKFSKVAVAVSGCPKPGGCANTLTWALAPCSGGLERQKITAYQEGRCRVPSVQAAGAAHPTLLLQGVLYSRYPLSLGMSRKKGTKKKNQPPTIWP